MTFSISPEPLSHFQSNLAQCIIRGRDEGPHSHLRGDNKELKLSNFFNFQKSSLKNYLAIKAVICVKQSQSVLIQVCSKHDFQE